MRWIIDLFLITLLFLQGCTTGGGTDRFYLAGTVTVSTVPTRIVICYYRSEGDISIDADGQIVSGNIILVGEPVVNKLYTAVSTSYSILFPTNPESEGAIDGICAWIDTDGDGFPTVSIEVIKVPSKIIDGESSVITSINYSLSIGSYVVTYRDSSGAEVETYLSLIGSTGFDFKF